MDKRSTRVWEKVSRWSPAALFVVALLFFLATMSRAVCAPFSGNFLARALGTDPFPHLLHPFWHWIVAGGGVLFSPRAAIRAANLLSVCCGAAAVVLLFQLVRGWGFGSLPEGYRRSGLAARASLFAGWLAAAVLAVSPPFWIVATRAHPAALNIFLLLLCAVLAQAFYRKPRRGMIYLLSFLWGLGCVQSPVFIMLAPAALLVMLWLLWRSYTLTWRLLGACAAAGLAGLSFYFVQAAWYVAQPAFEWREFNHLFHVVLHIWKAQYEAMRESLVPTGWIILFLCTFLPWISLYAMPLASARQMRFRAAHFFLYLVLAVVALAVLFNAPIAPWRMTGTRPFLIAPYVAFAAWAGRLAGLTLALLLARPRGKAPSWLLTLRRYAARGFIPLLAVLLLVVGWRNHAAVSTRPGDNIHRFARATVRALDGREWLITDGLLDDHLALAAREERISLHLLNLRLTQYRPYLRYVAGLIDDPRLRGLARVGLVPLIKEWFERDPDAGGKIAAYTTPDHLLAGGLVPVPRNGLFLGRDGLDGLDADALYASHETFWSQCVEWLQMPASHHPSAAWVAWARLRASRGANNLGVLFEDTDRDDLAFKAYTRAREIEPRNISAMLNLLSLTSRTGRPEEEELREEFETFVAGLRSRLRIWSLAYHHGYVRRAEAFASQGFAWALSGKPNVAIHEIRKAIEIGGDDGRLLNTLAGLYLAAEREEESEEAYLEALRRSPDSPQALLGLARAAVRRGAYELAHGYLDRLRELGADANILRLEQVALETLSGNPDRAIDLLKEIVASDPEHYKAWAALALTASEMGDTANVDRAMSVFERARQDWSHLGIALAQVEIRRGKYDRARHYLEQTLRARIQPAVTLEYLLRIDTFERRRDLAQRHAEQLLHVDPRNALANYILGTIHFSREQYALAEQFYRASVESRRTPEALNDLAWILKERGAIQEAYTLVTESLARQPRNPFALDTKGMILMHMDRLEEAENFLNQALAALPEDPVQIFHMGLLYERKQQYEDAYQTVFPLLDRVAEMDTRTHEDVRALLARLRQKR